MRKQTRIISFFLIFIFLLQSFNSTLLVFAEQVTDHLEWKEWTEKKDVPKNKMWNVRFNQAVDIDTLTPENMYVLDSNGKKIETSLSLENGRTEVLVDPPIALYTPNETYTLYITKGITTQGKKALKQNIKMKFTTNNDLIEEVESFVPREDSTNTVSYQENVEVLEKTESQDVQVIDEHTLMFPAGSHAPDSLQAGEVALLPPSDNYPFGLSKKIVSIEKTSEGTIVQTKEPALDEILETIDVSEHIPITLDHFQEVRSLSHTSAANENIKILENGVSVQSAANGDIKLDLSELEIAVDGINVTGGITLENPSLVVDLNKGWWMKGIEQGRTEISGTIDFSGSISSGKSIEVERKLKVADLYVPVPAMPVVGASLELFLVVDLEGNISFEISQSIPYQIGAKFDKGDIQPIKKTTFSKSADEIKAPTAALSAGYTAKAGVGMGVYFSITQLDLAGIEMSGGVKSEMSIYSYKNTACYNAGNYGYFDAKIKLKILETLKLNKSVEAELLLLGLEKSLIYGDYCYYVEDLKVTPEKTSIEPGEVVLIDTEKIFKAGNSNYDLEGITFTSSDPTVATVNTEGEVQVNQEAKAGSVIYITVVYNDGKGREIEKKVTVEVTPSRQEFENLFGDQLLEYNKPITVALQNKPNPYEAKVYKFSIPEAEAHPDELMVSPVKMHKGLNVRIVEENENEDPRTVNPLIEASFDNTVQNMNLNISKLELGKSYYLVLDGESEDIYTLTFKDKEATSRIEHTRNFATGGDDYSVLLKDDGTVWSMGFGRYGQNGSMSEDTIYFPEKLQSLEDIIQLSTGTSHSLALNNSGQVFAWGRNSEGQLGSGTGISNDVPVNAVPLQVKNLSSVTKVSAGTAHSLALDQDGKLWGWGTTMLGALGSQHWSIPKILEPVELTELNGLANIKDMAASHYFNVALDEKGDVWTWGGSNENLLGGRDIESYLPAKIISLTNVQEISAGREHVVALTESGEVFTFGVNDLGQLGDGTFNSSASAVQVVKSTGEPLNNVTSIATGYQHTLALDTEGNVWTWGTNESGQLGDGTTNKRNFAKRVDNLSNMTAIGAGGNQAFAIAESGNIYGWGENSFASLGIGTGMDSLTPQLVIYDNGSPFNFKNEAY